MPFIEGCIETTGDALKPTLPARPPKAFQKGRGWWEGEIETAKMTPTKTTTLRGHARCLLFEPVQHRADLSLSLSLSLCFAFLSFQKIQNLDVHPPARPPTTLPTHTQIKKK
jgi:hypothetical protein